MKKIVFVLILSVSFVSFAQEEVECEFYQVNDTCFKNFVSQQVISIINDDLFNVIKSDFENRVFYIDTYLTFNRYGEINPIRSDITTNCFKLKPKLDSLIDNFPKLNLIKENELKNRGNTYLRKLFFKLDLSLKKAIHIDDFDDSGYDYPLFVVEKAPVFKGCNEKKSDSRLKKCMNQAIGKHISTNFNTNIGKKLGLIGLMKIYVGFRIDKEGKIFGVRARAPHPDLAKEAERVINMLPKLKKAGYSNGKPIIIPYNLPINIRITE